MSDLDLLKRVEKNNWRSCYYSGFVSLQFGKIYREENNPLASALFEQALEDLKYSNKINSQAEVLALISSAYGKLASISMLNAIRYGSESDVYMIEALQFSKEKTSAKLNLVEATHLMFTPQMFGGDKKRAEELLLDALNFEIISDNNLIIWAGKAELYAYLAQLEFEKENFSKADFYCKKALEIEADYHFVLNELQPEISKKLGEKIEN